MGVADLMRLGLAPHMTPQQLADLALQADQEARLARDRGDHANAAKHDKESAELASLI